MGSIDRIESKAVNIWLDINVFNSEVRNCLATLIAIQRYKNNKGRDVNDNEFLALCEDSVWRYLSMEIVKIFDKDVTCGNENCSFEMFKKALDELDLDTVALQDNITTLCEKEKALFPKELRNKKMAHHDLIDVNAMKLSIVQLKEVEELVEAIANVLSQVGEAITLIKYPVASIEELAQKYEKAINDM